MGIQSCLLVYVRYIIGSIDSLCCSFMTRECKKSGMSIYFAEQSQQEKQHFDLLGNHGSRQRDWPADRVKPGLKLRVLAKRQLA